MKLNFESWSEAGNPAERPPKFNLGKMRAEHFSVKFLLCLPTTERRRAQRGDERSEESSEFGRTYINLEVVNKPKDL